MADQVVEVRAVTAADIPGVQQFLRQQCYQLFGKAPNVNQYRDIENIENRYLNPESNRMAGAFDSGGKLLGTIAISSYDDRMSCLKGRYPIKLTAEIGRCYVEAQQRRQGIGTLLFKHALTFCSEKEYKILYLHTHRFLPGGFDFWQKKGFTIVCEEYNGYDTVHMEKRL